MQTMKAIRIHSFGGPDALVQEDIAIPQAQDDEIVVRVLAASVNPVDYKTRAGQYPAVTQEQLPVVLGRDVCGVIENCGTRAHNMLRKGDPIYALLGRDRGGYAEYVVVKATEGAAPPRNLDPVQAAAVPLAGLTAWQGLFDHGGLQAGQRVLIHGGAGGVGHFAIQFAKARGAFVATTASGKDVDFVRGLGADQAIDYKAERFEDAVRDLDLVFDLISGETQERSWAVLKEGGILVSTLGPPDEAKARQHRARAAGYMAQPNAAQLREITGLIEAGKVRPAVEQVFPLAEVAEVAEAHRFLEGSHPRGKTVLRVVG
ncbi:NADP-dependent oxidoreductase [Belnapia sp. T6]|uniref:NADP-dependent oxidoreductase n=1 Tax=Belnapia mucosa TaxID=2804532 RepID=A0ABS1V0P9_9PROT|nr:NADP-dependent oxidoreductase [Belnapia mucosa]MBL6455280.1 NADP-dependent oxidoreductase [Belnapia mucosa]